jgi:hypothetical protein
MPKYRATSCDSVWLAEPEIKQSRFGSAKLDRVAGKVKVAELITASTRTHFYAILSLSLADRPDDRPVEKSFVLDFTGQGRVRGLKSIVSMTTST